MSKTDELETVLQQNNITIACITETWLKETVPSSVVNIPGYVVHRNDRSDGRRGGGVAVYVQQDTPCQRLTALEATDIESVWLLYQQPRMPRSLSHVIIGAVYHPPKADDKEMVKHLLDCLDTTTRDHPHAGVILLGDFNKLCDTLLLAYPLRQVVRSPTRKSAILDKIYTNLQDWYERPVILPNIGRSDHKLVMMMASSSMVKILRSLYAARTRMARRCWHRLYRTSTGHLCMQCRPARTWLRASMIPSRVSLTTTCQC